jgi:hypothetical protein
MAARVGRTGLVVSKPAAAGVSITSNSVLIAL